MLYALDKVVPCTIQIFDLTGKQVYEGTTTGKSGINSFQVDGNALAKGIYMIKLTAGNIVRNQKLILE